MPDTLDTHIQSSQPLSSQVGGHAGVLATEDKSLIIKPALPNEIIFYRTLQHSPELSSLLPFTPKFIGTLKLEGRVDPSNPLDNGSVNIIPVDIPEQICLVLENLEHSFHKPNIIDIKLGTVLYDPSASPEKVERMIKAAQNTTSLETGMRLTGFQVYDNMTGAAINTPRAYGKSIKAADLPEGIARFLPVHDPSGENHSQGLLHSTLLPILRAIRNEISELRTVYSSLEIRMVGGSILIMYEADWVHAEEGVKRLALSVSEGEDQEEEIDDEEIDDEDDDDDDDDDSKKGPGPPFVVKLIDFAHTRLVPGEGPDEGVLLGLDTILRLIDGRILQLS